MTEILKILEQKEYGHFACVQRINWNVQKISGTENANGYILQRFSRQLEPADAIDIKNVKDITYCEAWEVIDGKISEEDKGDICNDIFYVGNLLFPFLHFSESLGTKGKIRFSGEVYWVPFDSDLYRDICTWSRDTVEQAGGLRATYENIDIDPSFRHFVRDPFEHEWDLADEGKIYDAARSLLLVDCLSNDYDTFMARIDDMFKGEYSKTVDRIISEWKSMHND